MQRVQHVSMAQESAPNSSTQAQLALQPDLQLHHDDRRRVPRYPLLQLVPFFPHTLNSVKFVAAAEPDTVCVSCLACRLREHTCGHVQTPLCTP